MVDADSAPVPADFTVSAGEFVRMAAQAAEIDVRRLRVTAEGDVEGDGLTPAEEERFLTAYREVLSRFMTARRRLHEGS